MMKKTFIPFLLLLLSQLSFAQRAVPELWGHRVHDDAHILSQGFVDGLEAKLKQHEDSTGNQIAVLIISSLEGDEVEDFSLRVAEAWKLGGKENDNGVLLLIVVDDRKMRIEVGTGLEGVLTDALTNQIIRNEIAPAFRDANYEGGVNAGVQAIIAGIGNEYKLDSSASPGVQGSGEEMGLTERIIVGLVIFGILGVFTFTGVFQKGCGSWFLYFFLIPFYALFPHIVIGMTAGLTITAIYIVLYPIMKLIIPRTKWGKKIMKDFANTKVSGGSSSRGLGGWSSRSSWGGGSSGSSGGGFSGGGGSFGGGGSSGSW